MDKIYWDTCVFISYITGENRSPSEIAGMDYVAAQVEANKIVLVTSVVTIVETLYDLMEEEKRLRFINLFKRQNVQKVEMTYPIAQMANDIRSKFKNIGIGRLKTVDAIHAATAIWTKVNEFQTFDGCGNQPGLLGFNGHEILSGLKIITPYYSKYPLFVATISNDK